MDTIEQPNTAEADDATGPEAKTAEGDTEMEHHTETEAQVVDVETDGATVAEGQETARETDVVEEAEGEGEADATASTAPAPSPTPDPVCWILRNPRGPYRRRAIDPRRAVQVQRVVACSYQECLLAWMAQTDATACPHCHHTYDVDDRYPSTLQRLCDHPWGPSVVAGLVCGALFYAFHRLWVRMTRKRCLGAASGGGSEVPGSTATMSGSRLLAMMGGGLPAHLLMLPQMGGGAGGLFGSGASVSRRTSWNLTGLLAEVEVFALLVMVVYGAARSCTSGARAGAARKRRRRAKGRGMAVTTTRPTPPPTPPTP